MTIVVGYLKTKEGDAALNRGIEEAKLRQARLIVVHSMKGGERDEAEQTITYREELEGIRSRLLAEDIQGEAREFIRGQSPDDDVLEVATAEEAELIVIGLRRRSPVGKLVLGSNSQNILLNADCPVLAVKAEG